MSRTFIRKITLIVLGSMSLGLGVLGIILPLLPTTPFLLLASFCYIRSSKRINNWLLHNKLLGKYIYNYIQFKAIKKSAKIISIVFLWLSLGISFFLVNIVIIRLLLMLVGILVSLHIVRIKTLK